jgi:hypothetical protein
MCVCVGREGEVANLEKNFFLIGDVRIGTRESDSLQRQLWMRLDDIGSADFNQVEGGKGTEAIAL